MTLPLLDLGLPQGTISRADWAKIAASGVRGIYLRCGNGNDAPDPFFRANLLGARDVGLPLGVYHVGFPLPTSPDHPGRAPEDQAAAHFAASLGVGTRPGDLPPALDLEWPAPKDWPFWGVTGPRAIAWATVYLAAMAFHVGRTPILYLYPDYADHLAGWPFASHAARDAARERALAPLASSPLWLARYEVPAPDTIAPWSAPTVWQTSDGGGRLPNGRPVDEDLFEGDEAAWAAFRGLGADA